MVFSVPYPAAQNQGRLWFGHVYEENLKVVGIQRTHAWTFGLGRCVFIHFFWILEISSRDSPLLFISTEGV